MSLLIALLLGCDDPASPATPTLSTTPADLTKAPASLQACIASQCPDALTDADTLAACRAQPCAAREDAWSLSPDTIRHMDGILTVSVSVRHTPGGHGPIDTEPGEVWLGVTVLTTSGKDIDLAVQTVFPDRLDEPFVFSSEVGDEVQDIIFGLWGERIEPCDVARSGCQMFGFVLDESLAAWPPLTYTESPPRRQRIFTAPMTVQVNNGGMPLAEARKMEAALLKAAQEEARRFGVEVVLEPMILAPTVVPAAVLHHRSDHDGPLADAIAMEGVETVHDEAVMADFVLSVAGTAERLACMQTTCADLGDACDCR